MLLTDQTILWNNQARCRSATQSHVFSAFSPECACLPLPRLSAMFPLSFYLNLCCSVDKFTVFWNEQWWVHWKRGHSRAAQEEIAWRCWLLLLLPRACCTLHTFFCWQARPISYFRLNTIFISLRQSSYSQWTTTTVGKLIFRITVLAMEGSLLAL